MGILDGGIVMGTDAPPKTSYWQDKVKAVSISAPWWNSRSTVAVVEFDIAETVRVLMYVNFNGKTGQLFAVTPWSKRDSDYIPLIWFTDDDLDSYIKGEATRIARAWLASQFVAEGENDEH